MVSKQGVFQQPRNADIWAYRFHLLSETHQMEELAVYS